MPKISLNGGVDEFISEKKCIKITKTHMREFNTVLTLQAL